MGIMKNRLVFVFEISFIYNHFWLFFRFFGSKNTQKNRNFQFFLILDKNLKNKNQTFFHYAHRDLYTKFQVDILKNEKLVRVWNFKSYRRFSEKGSKFEKILFFSTFVILNRIFCHDWVHWHWIQPSSKFQPSEKAQKIFRLTF